MCFINDGHMLMVRLTGFCLQLQGLIGLPVERQMERILSCLVELRNGLPVFLRHA